LLNANAPRRAELEREKWQWAEARDDCDRLGGTLASLASLAEFDATRDAIDAGAEGTVIAVTRDVWIGGSTSLTQASNLDQLAASFQWESQEPWAFDDAGQGPWSLGQPDFVGSGDVAEQCVELRSAVQYRLNNRPCSALLEFALCERPGPSD
jgi:hypothetical protein